MKRYVYDYYLNDLLVCDKNSVLTKIGNLPGIYKNIVLDGVNNYRTVIALGIVSSIDKIPEWLEKIKQELIKYNNILDKYKVNIEMRFDVDDLPSAIDLYRTLFYFLEEDEWRKAIKNNRERIFKKRLI